MILIARAGRGFGDKNPIAFEVQFLSFWPNYNKCKNRVAGQICRFKFPPPKFRFNLFLFRYSHFSRDLCGGLNVWDGFVISDI
jgi:hypothetical protein